jgi:hypothetical protein
MFSHNLAKTALSAVGALFFTLMIVGAAITPAHMAEGTSFIYAAGAPQVAGVAHA